MNYFLLMEDMYKGESIENLYKVLRSMVETAEAGQADPVQQNMLLKDIDGLHAYILILLGMEHHALEVLQMNHPEVYEQAMELGSHIKSLI